MMDATGEKYNTRSRVKQVIKILYNSGSGVK